jgi:hypothetical protein
MLLRCLLGENKTPVSDPSPRWKRWDLILTFFIFCNSDVQAEHSFSVYGKIRKSEKNILGLNSLYFITFQHHGKLLAYPVDTDSKTMADKIKSFTDKDALIDGDIKKIYFNSDGQKYVVETFIPKKIKSLELSELGQTQTSTPERPVPFHIIDKTKENSFILGQGSNYPYEERLPPTRGPKQGMGASFRINDSVANGLIFTGAAVLLGSQLIKK